MVWSSRTTNCPSFWAPMWEGVQVLGGFVWCLTLTSDIKRQFTAPAGVRKAVAAQKHNSMVGIYEAPAKESPVLADLRGGLFPSLATMLNEGTWLQSGNPRRRELIPPGGNSQDVKYVSWYLCRATTNGFTYRNSQWDADSLQCPPDFTLHKDLTDTKSCHLPPLKCAGYLREKDHLWFTGHF